MDAHQPKWTTHKQTQCYKRILQIDPTNIQGLHNLCVVYVERGKLTQALDCLQHAHKLAPQEGYILKHLKIVQQRLANLKQAPGMQRQKTIAFAKYDPKDFGGSTATVTAQKPNDKQRDPLASLPKPIGTVEQSNADDGDATAFVTRENKKFAIVDTPNTLNGKNIIKKTDPKINHNSNDKANINTNANNHQNKQQQQHPKNGIENGMGITHNNANEFKNNKGNDRHDRTTTDPIENKQKSNKQRSNQQQPQSNIEQHKHRTATRYVNHEHQRYHNQFIHDNSVPMFVHDMDDPSSGTS